MTETDKAALERVDTFRRELDKGTTVTLALYEAYPDRPDFSTACTACTELVSDLSEVISIARSAAAPAGGEGEGWRPIESAPRDGTRILAWQDGDLYAVEWVYEAPDEGYWIARCGQPVVTPPTPTHWMPPPPAPSQEGGGRE